IAITGLRPGEKLFEELTAPSESLSQTRYEKVSKVSATQANGHNPEFVLEGVDKLVKAAQANQSQRIPDLLSDLGFAMTRNCDEDGDESSSLYSKSPPN